MCHKDNKQSGFSSIWVLMLLSVLFGVIVSSVSISISERDTDLGAPDAQTFRDIIPTSNNTYSVGTTSQAWKNVFTHNLTASSTVTFSNLINCDTFDSDGNGVLSCGTDDGGGGSFAWDTEDYGVSTSTTLGFLGGFMSTASSTFTGDVHFPSGVWESGGNVGVGTTSPDSLLSVEGDGEDVFAVRNTSGQNLIEADTTNGDFVVRNPGGTAGTDETRISHTGFVSVYANGDGNIHRFRGGSAGIILEYNQLVLENKGNNQDIGTISDPFGSLYLDDTLDIALQSDTQALSASTTVGQTADIIQISDTSGTAGNLLTMDSSGNVGVGQPSPLTDLHITNDQTGTTSLRIDNTNVSGAMALNLYDGSNHRGEVLYDTPAALLNVGTRINTGQVSFSTGDDAEAVRIDSSGQVGVGDATPAAQFVVGAGDPFQVDSSGNMTAVDATSTGSVGLTNYDCSGNTNGGALTVNANGVLSCSDDDSEVKEPFGWNVGTSTLNTGDYGSFGATATATVQHWTNIDDAFTLQDFSCETQAGSLIIRFGDGANWAASVTCGTAGTDHTFSTNNSFTAGEDVQVEYGSASTDFNNVNITGDLTYD